MGVQHRSQEEVERNVCVRYLLCLTHLLYIFRYFTRHRQAMIACALVNRRGARCQQYMCETVSRIVSRFADLEQLRKAIIGSVESNRVLIASYRVVGCSCSKCRRQKRVASLCARFARIGQFFYQAVLCVCMYSNVFIDFSYL